MTDAGPRFTNRQNQVVNGINRELSYAQIGAELGISENTVRAHVNAMAEKIKEPHELPPRWRILFWIRSRLWESARARLAKDTDAAA